MRIHRTSPRESQSWWFECISDKDQLDRKLRPMTGWSIDQHVRPLLEGKEKPTLSFCLYVYPISLFISQCHAFSLFLKKNKKKMFPSLPMVQSLKTLFSLGLPSRRRNAEVAKSAKRVTALCSYKSPCNEETTGEKIRCNYQSPFYPSQLVGSK